MWINRVSVSIIIFVKISFKFFIRSWRFVDRLLPLHNRVIHTLWFRHDLYLRKCSCYIWLSVPWRRLFVSHKLSVFRLRWFNVFSVGNPIAWRVSIKFNFFAEDIWIILIIIVSIVFVFLDKVRLLPQKWVIIHLSRDGAFCGVELLVLIKFFFELIDFLPVELVSFPFCCLYKIIFSDMLFLWNVFLALY